MSSAATPDDYYDHLPEPGHATGDIWCGMPSYGVLKTPKVAGIVITPACDLESSKSETITYLPILPIDEWFATFSMLTEVRGAIQNVLNALTSHGARPLLPRVPSHADVAATREFLGTLTGNEKLKPQVHRATSGLAIIEAIIERDTWRVAPRYLSELFGERDFEQRCQKLVRNSLRADTYFLPARGRWAVDGEDSLAEHSVALFRYPLTAPVAILDLASDAEPFDWEHALDEYKPLPAAQFFRDRKPLRVARLIPTFFHDLLSKYTALYARIGSPDFPERLVSRLASDITSRGKE